MDNPICSICLDEITDKNVTYKLSCNHVFHFTCFKKYVYKTTDCFFTDCPNCKQLNTHIEIPFEDGYKNLKALCCSQVGKERCLCHNKDASRCKMKSHAFNYGKCRLHNKGIVPKDKTMLMTNYIFHLMQNQSRSWITKVFMIDIIKKMLIKFPDINSLEDIYRYLHIYIADQKKSGALNWSTERWQLYDYYELEYPPEEWVNFCVNKKVLF